MPEILRNATMLLGLLKTHPGHILLAPDGKRLYGITTDIEGNENVLALDAEDKKFTDMTAEEIDNFIITRLKVQ